MIESIATLLFFVGVFLFAELVRPYRLRLEARLRARERSRYEDAAREQELRLDLESSPRAREIYRNSARRCRALAAKVRP